MSEPDDRDADDSGPHAGLKVKLGPVVLVGTHAIMPLSWAFTGRWLAPFGGVVRHQNRDGTNKSQRRCRTIVDN
jgi:hypothetical protein